MRKQRGITLISLVISIIVMLILAGVALNAAIGENGIISQTQYATFLNEMAAVEEAVALWKINQKETAIPANGLCQEATLSVASNKNAERLNGEVGYYRLWSMSQTMPDTSIFASADDFNSEFGAEVVYYPAGAQDLYYLDNEGLGIDSKKEYIIDAVNSMVYSTTGISIKGVRVYSVAMAKAVMSGTLDAPLFAEAEVSGTGTGDKLAGNEEHEYGFQIIADRTSNNIFKLYNNGDLYGKGIKGIQLNTSPEEMTEINQYVWNEFTIPDNVKQAGVKKIIPGYGTVYVIDNSGNLWAWGSNGNNKLGLTQDEQVEYTGREAIKLNIGGGKKVKEVYTGETHINFVITEDNLVYAAGYNGSGALGLGYTSSEIEEFTEVKISNVENIKRIMIASNVTLIWYNDDTFYGAGTNSWGILVTGSSGEYFGDFTQVYSDIDQDIKDILLCVSSTMILKKDGTIWQVGYGGNDGYGGGGDLIASNDQLKQFSTNFGSNVTGIYQVGVGRLITRINDAGEMEVWGTPGYGNNMGLGEETYNSNRYFQITLPEELLTDGIKEVFTTNVNVYYLSNSGKVYVSGTATASGLNLTSGKVEGIVYANLENIETMYSTDIIEINNASGIGCYSPLCFTGKDGTIYTTGNSDIVFRDNILQKNWKKIATNVKYFDASGAGYVDKDNNLWIAGSDSRTLGLGTDSETLKSINNYILHTDSNIQGRVAEVKFASGITMVRTIDNELWATGLYSANGGACYPGWAEAENKTTFVKLLDDVIMFNCSGAHRIAFTSTGETYGWGMNYSGTVGHNDGHKSSIYSYELPTEIGGTENIKSTYFYGWQRTNIITKTGELFLSGAWVNGAYDGGHTQTPYFSKYTYNLTLTEDEKIENTVALSDACSIILTSKGRLFGYGPANKLGIGNTSNQNMETQLISGIDNVSEIFAGAGFYIAVKEDGTVWGTGTNTYGILGRWIGIDRSSPNSRYKTAFEWVECPELEI